LLHICTIVSILQSPWIPYFDFLKQATSLKDHQNLDLMFFTKCFHFCIRILLIISLLENSLSLSLNLSLSLSLSPSLWKMFQFTLQTIAYHIFIIIHIWNITEQHSAFLHHDQHSSPLPPPANSLSKLFFLFHFKVKKLLNSKGMYKFIPSFMIKTKWKKKNPTQDTSPPTSAFNNTNNIWG